MGLTLTYDVPVHVLDLGPNLTAYFEMLPAINAFRCCNRFGQDVLLTKLPQELVDRVETFLVQDVRDVIRKEWQCIFRCSERQWYNLDHWSREEKVRAVCHEIGPVEVDGCSESDLGEALYSILDIDDSDEVHRERIPA